MEKKEKVSAKAQIKVVKPSAFFVALKGFDLEDGRRFEVGDKVSGISADEAVALQAMDAIAEDAN